MVEYSFALIILGVSYKMLLTEYVLDNEDRDDIPSQYDAPSNFRLTIVAEEMLTSFQEVWPPFGLALMP
jgi:hypothetical protein